MNTSPEKHVLAEVRSTFAAARAEYIVHLNLCICMYLVSTRWYFGSCLSCTALEWGSVPLHVHTIRYNTTKDTLPHHILDGVMANVLVRSLG